MSSRAFLSLGSNLGDSRRILEGAVSELRGVLAELRVSPLYRTDPQDRPDQPAFLNMAAVGSSDGTPRDLLRQLHGIEARAGRDRRGQAPKGPRTLDIDLIFFDDICRDEGDLQLPHPRYHRRAFVLIPLLDLQPDLADPCSGTALRRLLDELPPQGVYSAGSLNL